MSKQSPVAVRRSFSLPALMSISIAGALGFQVLSLYAIWVTFGAAMTLAFYAVGGLVIVLQRVIAEKEGGRMVSWGLIVFIGLWLILRDVNAVRRAQLMGNPMLIHIIVIGSGLAIHGGSAEGAMAAIVSGVFSALYVRWQQRFYGYIRRGVWHPGVFRAADPRGVSHA